MNPDDIKELLGIEENGVYRVNPETGIVEKEQGIGWTPTNVRVDPESGDICQLGLLGEKGTPTGVRIDPDSGRVQVEEGLLHTDTGLRVDPSTGRIQEHQLIGWGETGEKINPESGVLETQRGIGFSPGVTTDSHKESGHSPKSKKFTGSYKLGGFFVIMMLIGFGIAFDGDVKIGIYNIIFWGSIAALYYKIKSR